MIRKLIYSTLLPVSIMIGGCTSSTSKSDSGEKLNIVVSIPPQKYLVESLGGEYVQVKSVTTSDANPESFEPTVNTMLAIADADAYVPLGLLDFEKPLIEKLRSNSPELPIFDGSKDVILLYDTHGDCEHHHDEGEHHHHHDNAADPHIWSSVKNMKKMAVTTADLLIEKAPEHAEYFKHRRDSMVARLDSIENHMASSVKSSPSSGFLVWHPSLSYLANDYNLKQIVVGSHAKELSVKQLQQRIEDAVASGATIFFIQKEFDSDQAEIINSHINARLVELNTMNEDWESEMQKIADGFNGK